MEPCVTLQTTGVVLCAPFAVFPEATSREPGARGYLPITKRAAIDSAGSPAMPPARPVVLPAIGSCPSVAESSHPAAAIVEFGDAASGPRLAASVSACDTAPFALVPLCHAIPSRGRLRPLPRQSARSRAVWIH